MPFVSKVLVKPLAVGLLCGSSALAFAQPGEDRVFVEYGQMLAINDLCKRRGIDHTAKLDELTQARIGLLQKMAAHSAAPAHAKAELQGVIERLRKNDHDKAAYDKQRKASLQLSAKKREAQCATLPLQADEELATIRHVQPLIEMMGQLPGPAASAASAPAPAAASGAN